MWTVHSQQRIIFRSARDSSSPCGFSDDLALTCRHGQRSLGGACWCRCSSETCKVTCGKSAPWFLALSSSADLPLKTNLNSSFSLQLQRKKKDRTTELISNKKPNNLRTWFFFNFLTKGWCKWNITEQILAKLKTNSNHHLMWVKI